MRGQPLRTLGFGHLISIPKPYSLNTCVLSLGAALKGCRVEAQRDLFDTELSQNRRTREPQVYVGTMGGF